MVTKTGNITGPGRESGAAAPKCYGRLFNHKAVECSVCEYRIDCAQICTLQATQSVPAPSKDAPFKDTAPKDTPSKDAPSKDTAPKDTLAASGKSTVKSVSMKSVAVEILKSGWFTRKGLVSEVIKQCGGKGAVVRDVLINARKEGILLDRQLQKGALKEFHIETKEK